MTIWKNIALTELMAELQNQPENADALLMYNGPFVDLDTGTLYNFRRNLPVVKLLPQNNPPLFELALADTPLVWTVAPGRQYRFETIPAQSKAAETAVPLPRESWPHDILGVQERIERGEKIAALRPEWQTRKELIDPILEKAGWRGKNIARNYAFLYDNEKHYKHFCADYVLYVIHPRYSATMAAVIEVKRESLDPDYGLEQGKIYAEVLAQNVPYVFATNGREFVQYDRAKGTASSPLPMAQFPKASALEQQIARIPDNVWRIDKDAFGLKTFLSQNKLDGDREDNVERVAQLLLPARDVRQQSFEFLAESILYANGLGTGTWETTLGATGSFIRFSVGKLEVLTIFRNVIHIVIDRTVLTEQQRHDLGKCGLLTLGPDSVASSMICNFRAAMLPVVKPLLLDAYHSLLGLAADSVKAKTGYRQHHSPGVIDYLRTLTKQKIPHPIYS